MIKVSKRTVFIVLGVLFTIFVVLLLVALSLARTTGDQAGPLAAILPPSIPTDISLTSTPLQAEIESEAGSIADIPVGTPPDSSPGLPTATQIGAVPGLILTPADELPPLDDIIVLEVEHTPLPPETILQDEGSGAGSTPVFDLPPGMYRIFFATGSPNSIVIPVVLEGDCSTYPLFVESNPVEGSTIYRSTGCQVRFDVKEVEGDWTIRVDTVTKDGLSTVPVDLSGDGPSTSNLIDLPAGDYHLDLESDSPYSMVIPMVVDGPCLEQPVILAENPGHFEATYRSMGCQIVFQISSVTDTWNLAITLDD
jgi:hypothetical protein